MAGTRALFASIGASVALVVAAALALLAVSAVFAFGGWSDFGSGTAGEEVPLVFANATSAVTAAAPDGKRIVVRAPAPQPRRETPRPAAPATRPTDRAKASVSVDPHRAPSSHVEEPVVHDTSPPPPPPAPPTTGDRVSGAGKSISSKVQATGAALAAATEPLAAPVSEAVQQVLNLVADVVRRTADGLGGAVDSLLTPKR